MKEQQRIRSYFGAGPAKLPAEVLAEAANAVIDFEGSGLSVLEIPHRGKAFAAILEEANALVNELCGLKNDFELLWLQGGGRLQFAMLPANFLGPEETAGYIDSGHWAADAAMAAQVYGKVSIVTSSKAENYQRLPEWPDALPDGLSYLHLTTNNTIYGTQWQDIPATNVPLVADMSSDFLSCPRPYTDFSLFYAVAQKNIGPAGVTLVAIRKDFLQKPKRSLPPFLSYQAHVSAGGLLHTPPVFAIYTSLLNLRWLKQKGLEQQFSENRKKAALVYAAIEKSSYFRCPAAAGSRSGMNVVFRGRDETLEAAFAQYCRQQGLAGLEGHRSTGGFRASLYNAVSLEDAQKLAAAIEHFKPENKS